MDYYFPELPENSKIKRGDALVAKFDIPYLKVSKGMILPLGYNGASITSAGLRWDVDQLNEELEKGAWDLKEEVIKLDSIEAQEKFLVFIEQRQLDLAKLPATVLELNSDHRYFPIPFQAYEAFSLVDGKVEADYDKIEELWNFD
jgi:hypothetical protein